MRAELAFYAPLDEPGHLIAKAGQVGRDVLSPEDACDFAAFQEHEVQRDFWNLPRGEANNKVAPAPGNAPQSGLRIWAANAVIDHVRPLAAVKSANRLLH